MSDQSASDLLERVRQTDDELPFELREAILEAESNELDVDELVDGLIDILREPALRPADERDASPPSHAALLLGLLEADEAIEPLLDTIEEQSERAYLATTAAQALHGMSEVGQQRLIERYESTDSEVVRRRIARGLAQLAPHCDERALEVLVRELERETDPSEGSSLLSEIAMVAVTLEVDDPQYADRITEWYNQTATEAPSPIRQMIDVQYAQATDALESDPPDPSESDVF